MATQLNSDRIEDLVSYLHAHKGPLPSRVTSTGRGVYVLWLDAKAFETLGLEPGRGGAAYAGVAGGAGGLAKRFREEWRPAHSGRSSPRRTLGMLLQEVLGLEPQPRPPGNSPRDCEYYCFGSAGEMRLTAWLDQHAQFSHVEVDIGEWSGVVRVEDIETQLIGALRPPLNLTRWPNPATARLTLARAEAKKAAARQLKTYL